MSCSNCGDNLPGNPNPLDPCNRVGCDNPCNDSGDANSAACESLPSQIDNFTLQFFGDVVKTEVDGKVVWSLPCSLDTGLPANPRGETEPLGCYFLRLFQDGIVGEQGPTGDKGAPGVNGVSAYTTVLAPFATPTLEHPYVQLVTIYNANVVAGENIFIEDSGWYNVAGTDGSGVLFANLVALVSDPVAVVPVGAIVVPAGQTGAGTQGPQGVQGVKGQQGLPGVQGAPGNPAPNVTNYNGFFFTAVGVDFLVALDTYAPVGFGGGANDPIFTLPIDGTYLLVAKTAANTGADMYFKFVNNNSVMDIDGTEQKISPSAANEFRHCTFTSIFTGLAADQIQLYVKGSIGYMDGGLVGVTGGTVLASAIQIVSGEERLVIVGTFTGVNGVARNRIARLLSNGALDTSFNPEAGQGVPSGAVQCIDILSDNRIVIGGTFTSFKTRSTGPHTGATVTTRRLALLDTAGDLDAAWVDPNVNNTVFAVQAQSDFNLVIGGAFTAVNGTARLRIARVDATGVLDGTFGTTTNGANGVVRALLLLQTTAGTAVAGDIMLGGDFTFLNGVAQTRLGRVSTLGLREAAFTDPNLNGSVYALAEDLIVNPGYIFVGGNFTLANGAARQRIVCLVDDGTNDNTFSATTEFAGGIVQSIALDAAGDVFAGGLFTSYEGNPQHYLSKLHGSGGSRGHVDALFGDANVGVGGVQSVKIIPSSQKILVAGAFEAVQTIPRGNVARLNTDGTLDTVAAGIQSVAALYTDISWIRVA